jgi:alkylation response protein AidB-like acyl-CoA dehydrogenase
VTADVVVLAHDGALHVVEARDVRAIEQPSIDGARRLARVARPTAISAVCDVRTIERAVDRATLYTAAQLVGLGRRCLDLSVAYARERHQFGRPIGSYQALRHRMADDWTALEFARPLVWRAAWSMSHGSPDATLHASAAKAAASVAARRAASTAMQVHGAMGYTFECDVQLFLKRILALSTAYGNARAHRRRLGEVLRSRAITAVP